MAKTRIGILGYGNLGRGVELACRQNDRLFMEFTQRAVHRRDPATDEALDRPAWPCTPPPTWRPHGTTWTCCSFCAAAAQSDLPEQTPACASLFNVVDSFDTTRTSRPLRERGRVEGEERATRWP